MKSSKETVIVKQELFIGLTQEQIAKVKACKSQEEILKVAKEEGLELTDEQLEAVSGGCGTGNYPQCPNCGGRETEPKSYNDVWGYTIYRCHRCNNCFTDQKEQQANKQ